jgi:prophage maintenance system killer protein
MSSSYPVLPYHDLEDSRYSLEFVTDDKGAIAGRISELHTESDVESIVREEQIDGNSIYLLYSKVPFERAYPDFETDEEVIAWFDERFSDDDKQVLFAVVEIFDGIITEKEEQEGAFSTYKAMEYERITDILNRVQWRQAVPDVGAELLSQFILIHPMSNTNHRTAIALLDRYFTSYDENFEMPDTGEEGRWYSWAVEYIHDSKRILTLRRNLPLFCWAKKYGYEAVERKEGIRISFRDIDFDIDDPYSYYSH